MKQYFLRDKVHSKWLILFIDQMIVISTLIFTIGLMQEGDYRDLLTSESISFIGLYSLLSIFVFISLRINTGIIRYSNTEDIQRLFLAIFIVSSVCVGLYKLLSPWIPTKWNGLEKPLILNFFISCFLLVFWRITVRSLYSSLKNLNEGKKEKILIYGSDHHALLIKKAINADETKNWDVVGFIDNNTHSTDKYIEQKIVFPFDSLAAIKDKYQVHKILFSENSLNSSNRIRVMEMCNEASVHLIKVPSSDKWLYGKFDSHQLKDVNIDDLLGREPIRLDKTNILKEINGKRVLITGAAGSIGSEIVRQVLNYKPEMVILCDQAETPLHDLSLALADQYDSPNIKIFIADIKNSSRIKILFDQYYPEIVFHAAAYKHVPMMEENPTEAVLTNILGTKILADISVEYAVEKFVMISTDKAVNPTNVMGASKRLAEIYIQSLNARDYSGHITRFVTTRFGNVLGSSGSVIPRFKSQIERRVPITVTHPEITRYFMTIPEAVELVLEAGSMGKGGEIFLFDMGEPIKIIDLAINMIKLAGLRPYVDIDIVFTGLRPGEKICEELLLMEEKHIHTHHPKIKISQHISFNYFQINHTIKELIEITNIGNEYKVVKKMKDILPDYISNNSKYEKLDLLASHQH